MNNPDCKVCRGPVDDSQWAMRMKSDWENTTIWVTWHDFCVEGQEIEIEYDLLSGREKSPVGLS